MIYAFYPARPPPPISMLAPAFQEQDLFVWFPWVARIVVNIEIGGRGLNEVEPSTAKVAESRLLCFDFFFHVRSLGHLRSSSKDAQTLTNTSDATNPCEQPARNFAKELLPTVATEKEPPGRPPLDQRNPHRAPNFMFNLLQVGQRAGV